MIPCLRIVPGKLDISLDDRVHEPWCVKIYTLDRFTVLLRNGEPLSFAGKPQKRPLELLKVLIAHGGREVGVPTLIDALWKDADGDAGQITFNSTLHRLRKLLDEEGILVLRDGRLTLSAQHAWVDTWVFNRILSQFDEEVWGTNDTRLEKMISQIFLLYRAPFLSDIDMPWAVPMRERLRSRFLQHILRVGDHYERVRRWRDALHLYEHALGIDHLAEELYRRLMAVYCHLGRRADALVVYQRCERTLTATLGVPPSRETRLLRDRMQRAG